MVAVLPLLLPQAQLQRRNLFRERLAYLRQHGLDLKNLGDFDPISAFAGSLTVTFIARLPGARFDLANDGDEAVIIEALGRDGETVIDLVAWLVDQPMEVMTFAGAAAMLGSWRALPRSNLSGAPLLIYRTPLGWLQAGCNGVVILDKREGARMLIDFPGRISGEDQRHTGEILRMAESLIGRNRFVAPRRPRIREAA